MTFHGTALSAVACVLMGLLMLVGSGCAPEAAPPPTLKHKNVLLISIDTVRIDYLEPYGSTKIETPQLAELAREGRVFLDAVTPVPLTVPAHATLLTGLHPIHHGVQNNFSDILSDAATTLAELFREAGYRTGGVAGSILLSRRAGFDQGFDFYEDRFTRKEFEAIQPTVERKAIRVYEITRDWLDQIQAEEEKKPFFLFLHFYDPHKLYQPPEPFKSRYPDDPYGGEIAYVDDVIGHLIDDLKVRGLYDDMMVVVDGDHGEGLGDHQEQTHGLFLYEETVRVPLLVKLPQGFMDAPGKMSHQSVSLEDVAPTLMDLCELSPAPTDGMSLRPWLLGNAEREARWTVHETRYPLTYNWSPLFALRNREWKFVKAPRPELYNLASDPNEKVNLTTTNPEQAKAMQTELENRLADLTATSPFEPLSQISSGQAEILASLGYVGGGSGDATQEVADNLPDPKDKVDVYQLVDQGLALLAQRRTDAAIEMFQEAAEKDPNNPTPYLNRGLAAMQAGQWALAEEYTRKARQLAPDQVLIQLQLARISIAGGHLEEAREILKELIRAHPQQADAYFQMGWADMQEKKWEWALKHFEEARERMPDMPGLDEVMEAARKGQG